MLGNIWNVLITIVFILASAFVIYLAAIPEIDFIGPLTVAEKIIYSAMTILFIMYPIYFVLLFKPSLRKMIKSLPRLKAIHYIAFVISCWSAVLVLCLIGQLL